MPITGTPTDGSDNLVTVTPSGFYEVDGQGGTDTLSVDFSSLTTAVEYRSADYGWYRFTDDFFSGVKFINFERFILRGGSSDDTLVGGNDNDQFYGGNGADTITSGLGADIIDGGSGAADRWVASYGSVNASVNVTLPGSAGSPWTVSATGAVVSNIEQIDITTYIGADVIDTMQVTGSDHVETGDGNDIFRTAGGIDSFNGGADTDRMVVDYSDATTAVSHSDIGYGWWRVGDLAGTQSVDYINVDSFDITGGSDSDSLKGGGQDDRLVGNAGNDWLNGGGGIDIIDGGDGTDTWQVYYYDMTEPVSINLNNQTTSTGATISGIEAINYTGSDAEDTVKANAGVYNDTFVTNGADDEITTGRGHDSVNAGAGEDTMIMDWSGIADPLQGITNEDAGYGWRRYASASGDQLDYINVDHYDITGGAGEDYLLGGALYDWLRGNGGNDTLNSGTGEALIAGGDGNDRWIADLSAATGPVRINAADSQTSAQGGLAGLNIRTIEALNLTTGALGDNINTMGYALNDTVVTNGGNDTIALGLGLDSANGGSETDKLVVDWSSITDPLNRVINTDQGYGWWRFATRDGLNAVDYINIEQFDLTGGAGADQLAGGSIYDWLRGGDGNDSLNSRQGDALIDGGAGNDRWTADLSGETKAVNIDAALSQTTSQAAGSGSDVRNIEAVTLYTGLGNDNISTQGYALDDWVATGTGNDTISLGLGNDTINGEGGTGDILVLDYSALTSNIGRTDAGYGWMRYADADGTASANYINIERFYLTGGSGDDRLYGAAGNDYLKGNAGNDVLDGYRGKDQIIGGAGTDTWVSDYSNAAEALNLTLNSSGNGTLSGINTTISGIENVTFVSAGFNDIVNLTASTGNDNISTNGGNDTIDVGAGRVETVNGGSDTDTLIFDAALASGGLRLSSLGYGWMRYASKTGDYTMDFINIEQLNIDGSSKADRLSGFGGADVLNGKNGNDLLEGGNGNDTLTGGTGNDQFYFSDISNSGVDTITDAAAGDFLRFNIALNGAVGTGSGGSLLAGQAEVSSAGGVTTLWIGVDGTAGADFHVLINGTFGAGNFALSGSDITIL